ncbi:MAG: NAD-dependent malic enzyme, partial [Acidimicrobiales bacterium]
RTAVEFDRLHDDLERHIYLRALQDYNEVLFYRFVQDNLTTTLPIVYTPTVGVATEQFSRIYRRPRGLFLSYPDRDRMASQLDTIGGEVDVVVVTDGERVLGLGDQGVGGMAIPIGKLSLYSAFGGIDPTRTLPIMLDVGTNNHDLLGDEWYLGWRHERVGDAEYGSFVEQFVTSLDDRFGGVLLQWEDFAQRHATTLLYAYRDRILSFNDDIQGTAAVALAAIWAGIRSTGRSLAEQRFCIAGAGSAGTGIASMIRDALIAEGVQDPLGRLFLLDSKGLIHDRRSDLKPHQVGLAHPLANVCGWANPERPDDLATVVARSGATVLIGVSGQPNTFTEAMVGSMLSAAERPIIMPLSNPTSRAEATPADLLAWSDGRAIVATGSPFDDVVHAGITHHISQSNNVYIFPGLGLGAVAVGATAISDRMLMTAASMVTDACGFDPNDGILPTLDLVPAVSTRIASAVARVAVEDGLAADMSGAEIDLRITSRRWEPTYPTVTCCSEDP